MLVGAVAILTEGGGMTMPNTVAGAGKARCSGSSGRVACAWWHMTVKQKLGWIGAGIAQDAVRYVHCAYPQGRTLGSPKIPLWADVLGSLAR